MAKYKVVVGENPEDLNHKVSALMNSGWQLAGGMTIGATYSLGIGNSESKIVVTGQDNKLIFCQAVYRNDT